MMQKMLCPTLERLTEQFAEKGLKLRKGRWTVREKKTLNNNFIDFAHEHEEEIGDPTDIATSENKSRAWEVNRLKQELRFLCALCYKTANHLNLYYSKYAFLRFHLVCKLHCLTREKQQAPLLLHA